MPCLTSSRTTLERMPLMEHPLDEGIAYEPFVWKKRNSPTLWDYLCYLPHNLQHFLKNLSKAFGWKFVVIVTVVYGLQQGLGNAWFFQARDYYFKDYMGLEPAEAQANIAAAHTPWNSKHTPHPPHSSIVKPLYGMASDTLFLDGLQRTPFIIIAGAIGSAAFILLSAIAKIVLPLVVILFFGVNFSVSSPDVMIDASIAEKCKQYPKFASDLQALCWGAYALFSVLGFATSGVIIQYAGPRLTFGILVITSTMVFASGSLGYLGEKRQGEQMENKPSTTGSLRSGLLPRDSQTTADPPVSRFPLFKVNFENYRTHKRIFQLAIFISVAACSLSVVVLATSNWTIRFSSVLFVAFSVSLGVYFANKKNLPRVANVALYIFLREALCPDIETTMFYW